MICEKNRRGLVSKPKRKWDLGTKPLRENVTTYLGLLMKF